MKISPVEKKRPLESFQDLERERFHPTALDVIRNRRSTRSFLHRPVEESIIHELLEYACLAPSAMNGQPWSFVVIQDKGLLKKINKDTREFLKDSLSPHERLRFRKFLKRGADLFYGAGTVIVICSAHTNPGFPGESDCFLAAENLMLAATAMNLATCPIGFVISTLNSAPYRKYLNIPDSVDVVLPIALGYAAKKMPVVPRNAARVLSWQRPFH